MQLLILFFILSIAFSFLCSIWEAVLLSVTPSYINTQVQKGTAVGKSLELFKKDIDRPLSAVLTLNTIAHTVGAIGVGVQAGKVFGHNALNVLGLSISMESIIAGVMTLAILVLSEIIPKTLGANLWKELAPFTVRSLNLLLIILAPFVWISQLITKNLKSDKEKSVLSRADFAALTQVGQQSGALDDSESNMISNLLRLDELAVSHIMTPRSVALMSDESTTIGEFYEQTDPLPFSRVPLFKEDIDHLTGLVLKADIYKGMIHGKANEPLSSIKRNIRVIRSDSSLREVYQQLIANNEHMAAVVDEFGNVVGLVTMEDLIETIFGLEIVDESDTEENMQRLARKKWEERAKRYGLLSDDTD